MADDFRLNGSRIDGSRLNGSRSDVGVAPGRQGSLHHYCAVRDGLVPPHFHQVRSWQAERGADLWNAHALTQSRWKADQWKAEGTDVPGRRDARATPPDESRDESAAPEKPAAPDGPSLLDLKVSLAERMLDDCDLCPHHCRVNRNRGETGFCGVADKTAVHWEGILHGEEIELMASHEVFLSGCTMRCAFCYSHEHITRPMSGLTMVPQEIAGCVDRRRGEGASNLNLVGGEPTVHIPNLLKMLRAVSAPLPVVWNSNMYATPQAMALLDGVVDLFLGDIHFGNDACARRLGLIPDYCDSVQAALVAAASSGADVIVRHLVMPGHLDCCARPAMEWAAQALPETPFHLMFQYVPDFRAARDPVLGRFLSPDEIRRAGAMARETGVNLYDEGSARRGEGSACREQEAVGATPVGATAVVGGGGQAVDIIIQGDGRVSFARLLPELLPVAAALDGRDPRVLARTATRTQEKWNEEKWNGE